MMQSDLKSSLKVSLSRTLIETAFALITRKQQALKKYSLYKVSPGPDANIAPDRGRLAYALILRSF